MAAGCGMGVVELLLEEGTVGRYRCWQLHRDWYGTVAADQRGADNIKAAVLRRGGIPHHPHCGGTCSCLRHAPRPT